MATTERWSTRQFIGALIFCIPISAFLSWFAFLNIPKELARWPHRFPYMLGFFMLVVVGLFLMQKQSMANDRLRTIVEALPVFDSEIHQYPCSPGIYVNRDDVLAALAREAADGK